MEFVELRKLHLSKDYEKIHNKILEEVKNLKKNIGSFKNDLNGLKSMVLNEIKTYVYAHKSIPTPLINISILLGMDFELQIKELIISYLSPQYSADFQQFLNYKFKNLASLKECYAWIDEMNTKIILKYSNLPENWNLNLDVIIRLYTQTKQKISDFFFYCESNDFDFVDGFEATMKFEKKNAKIFNDSKCCVNEKNISVHTKCIHVKMLSALFLPNIKIYLKSYFDNLLRDDYKQNETEMHIISRFLSFFRDLKKIYKNIDYLENETSYRLLLQYFDSYLSVMIRNMKLETDFYNAAVVLNTLGFIKETLHEFIEQIKQRTNIDNFVSKSYNEIRRVERYHNSSIDNYLSKNLKFLDFGNYRSLSKNIIYFMDTKVTFEDFKQLSEDVKLSIVEAAISCILSNIYLLKMNVDIAEIILLEIVEVKRYLKTKMEVVPMIDIVERYLKIFLCSVDNSKNFYENFELLSGGVFSFDQILKALENQEKAKQISIESKSIIEL